MAISSAFAIAIFFDNCIFLISDSLSTNSFSTSSLATLAAADALRSRADDLLEPSDRWDLLEPSDRWYLLEPSD
jgi:hypothetical protein